MGKKTSVYLTDQMLAQLEKSGRSLPEVIRTGLGMAPAAVSSRPELVAALREAVRDALRSGVEGNLAGAISGENPEDVHDAPKLTVVPERPKLPTLDRRITQSTEALVTEWSSTLDNEPEPPLQERVRGQVHLLLESGVVPADIARGLARWQASDSSGTPELIPEVVEQVMESGE